MGNKKDYTSLFTICIKLKALVVYETKQKKPQTNTVILSFAEIISSS